MRAAMAISDGTHRPLTFAEKVLIAHAADPPMFQIEDRQTGKFGEEQLFKRK